MTTYVIEEVVGSREWGSPPNGPNVDYTLALVGVPEQVRLTQKPNTPAPVAGQELDLTLEPFPAEQIEKYSPLATMLKARKVQQGGGMFGGPRPEDPARSRAIQRMASQDRAIRLVELGFTTGKLPIPEDYKGIWELVVREADRLDRDVDKARAGS